MTCSWYEDGELRQAKDKYPKGVYKFVDGLFTRISKEDPVWDGSYTKRQNHEGEKSGLHIITDGIEFKSHHDGKHYSSKHKYYQSLKDTGNHVVEAGENYMKNRQIQGDYNIKKELKQALEQHLR